MEIHEKLRDLADSFMEENQHKFPQTSEHKYLLRILALHAGYIAIMHEKERHDSDASLVNKHKLIFEKIISP